MSHLLSKYVPDEGPEDADIMCVGEAPGKMEHKLKRPFVSKRVAADAGVKLRHKTAGDLLERYMRRCGCPRETIYLANLGHYRPKGNRFTKYFKEPDKLEEGLEELGETINQVDPNIIIALGNWPMYFLTGSTGSRGKKGTGITSWRGSILPATDEHIDGIAGRKVMVTYHPAYIIRPGGFQQHPIFHFDLEKAVEQSTFPDIRYPEYESLIDPPNISWIADEMMEAEWLSVDIETFGDGQLACIGFADSPDRGLCLTYESPVAWSFAQSLLRSDAKKIFQFGTYDINWLKWFYDWEVNNYAFDTYIATANLLPEFKRGLDFLASIYTDFPFYKEERKVWKNDGNVRTLWEYNIKDIIATYIIAMKQMEELEDIYPPEEWGSARLASPADRQKRG